MAQRRWQCPSCGSGLLAPGRMRRDDTRRFCLSCSAKTGRLVERVCPALERQREQTKTERAERASAQRVAERAQREAREVIDGVDVGREIARLIKLPAFRDELPPRLRRQAVRWTLHRSQKPTSSGHAYAHGRIHLTFALSADAGDVKTLILHELAHYVIPSGEGHGSRWARCFARGAREGYGVDVRARPGREDSHGLHDRVREALG